MSNDFVLLRKLNFHYTCRCSHVHVVARCTQPVTSAIFPRSPVPAIRCSARWQFISTHDTCPHYDSWSNFTAIALIVCGAFVAGNDHLTCRWCMYCDTWAFHIFTGKRNCCSEVEGAFCPVGGSGKI